MKFGFIGQSLPTTDRRHVRFEIEYTNPIPASPNEVCCELVQYLGDQEMVRLTMTAHDVVKISEEVSFFNLALQSAALRVEAARDALDAWTPDGRPT